MEKILIRFRVWPVSADLECSEQAFIGWRQDMGDQLGKQIHPDQDAEWRQERCVMAESDGGKRMRRHPIELRASDGFGPLEQIPTKAWSWAIAPGMCSGGAIWRRSAKADKN
jgi:hypothetical protein